MTITVERINKVKPEIPADHTFVIDLKITTDSGDVYLVSLPASKGSLLEG